MKTLKGILMVLVAMILVVMAVNYSEAKSLSRDEAKKMLNEKFYPGILYGVLGAHYGYMCWNGPGTCSGSEDVKKTVKNLEAEGFISVVRKGDDLNITITDKGKEFLLPQDKDSVNIFILAEVQVVEVTGIQTNGNVAKIEYNVILKLTPVGRCWTTLPFREKFKTTKVSNSFSFDSPGNFWKSLLELEGKEVKRNATAELYDDGWRF